MAWHYGTYNCGHEGRTNIVGPTKNRDYIAERKFSGLCPECYEKHLLEEREIANAVAAEKAAEMELPSLIGSEKQVAWANTLRQKFIEKVEAKLERVKESKQELVITIFDFILTDKTEAKWFIDNRFDFEDLETLFNKVKTEIKTEKDIIETKTELQIKAECTIKPENAITEVAVEIEAKDDKITVRFEKNENFRLLLKSLKFEWENGVWVRKINNLTGTSRDRAAELGNKLLNAGFPVMIMDGSTRDAAVTGTYEPECNRWVMVRKEGEYAGCLAIKWWKDNDKLYKTARKLPGSRWSNASVVVKIEHYKEVEEFARMYDFKFTESVLTHIAEYVASMKKVEVVVPAIVKTEEPKDGLTEILKSSRDVIDDLKDDD